MKVSNYRLNSVGKLGAALFILPTPIGAWKYSMDVASFANRSAFQRRMDDAAGIIVPEFSMLFYTLIATATLAGLAMLLVGREIVSPD